MDNEETSNNPNFTFYWKSPVGKFFIRYNFASEKWDFGTVDDWIWGSYSSPIAAANDVYCQVTGCFELDRIDAIKMNLDIPTDIFEWEKVPNKG